MKKYATEQRQYLLSFLKEHYDRQFSVEDIAGQLCDEKNISISAIYRNINQMVADGYVQRFSADKSRKFLYQYIGGSDCSEHLHLKCEKCGQLFHMDDKSMELILDTATSNNFSIDKQKTVFYGSCKSCDK